jgi:hypothetical protein
MKTAMEIVQLFVTEQSVVDFCYYTTWTSRQKLLFKAVAIPTREFKLHCADMECDLTKE